MAVVNRTNARAVPTLNAQIAPFGEQVRCSLLFCRGSVEDALNGSVQPTIEFASRMAGQIDPQPEPAKAEFVTFQFLITGEKMLCS